MADKYASLFLRRRDFLILTTTAAGAVVLAACAPAESQSPAASTEPGASPGATSATASSTPASTEPVTLSWLTVIPQDFPAWDGRRTLMAQYTDLHPNVTFTTEILPFDQWHTQTLGRALAGDAPSIAEHGQMTAELVVADTLVQTDAYFERDGLNKEDYWRWLVEILEFDGKTWGHPGSIDIRFSYINEDILGEVGAQPPVTWDDLLELAAPVRAIGKYATGIYFNPEIVGTWQHGAPLFSTNGATLIKVNPDLSASATLNTPEAVETVEFIQNLLAGEAIPPTTLTDVSDVLDQAFIDGKLALLLTGNWALPRFDNEKALGNMSFSPLLGNTPKNKVDGSTAGGMSFYIFKTDVNPDISWEFITSMQTDEAMNLGWTHAFPGPKSGVRVPYYSDDPRTDFIRSVLEVSSAPVPPVAGWLQLLPVVWRNVAKAVSGQLSAQDAMEAGNAEVQALLDTGHNVLVKTLT